MDISGSFGGWVRQRRKALDLTQAEIADQVGCAVTTIQKMEADLRRPSKQIAERLAEALAISPDDQAAFLSFARRKIGLHAPLTVDRTVPIPSHNLPPQSTPFIGREPELAQIVERLADPGCRLLTLVGPGGIGKTRLGIQAAAARIEDFADGVHFVSLTPVGSTTLIAAAIANVLQISFYGTEDPNVQVVNYLCGKQMLLVMDNYEHLLAGIDLLADLLANAPRLKLLVTSRERLNMQEEWVLPVEGLLFPAPDATGTVDSYSAVQLFMQTARRVQPGFELTGNQNAVADICQAVEGMPLGIELAATWLRAMPCGQIATEIRRDLDFLTTPHRNVPERHRSLRAVFEHSWGLLSEAEREVVMTLSVFRGGIDSEAAEQVARATRLQLASLVDKSLVRVNALGRYEMHELLRQFAADKLIESGQIDNTRQCHFQFFLGLAEKFERQLFGPEQVARLDRLEIEHDNFRAALDYAERSGDAESGLRLAGALGWFWNRRSYWSEGRAWLEKFLAEAPDAPLPLRAKAFHHVIELSYDLCDDAYALALSEQALPLAREVTDPWVAAWLLESLGYVGYPDHVHCEAYLEEALARFRQIGDLRGISETLCRLAQRLFQRSEFARAGELQQEGIRLARQADDQSVLCSLLILSACNDWFQGRIDQRTEQIAKESLALFRAVGYKGGTTGALYVLAKLAQKRGADEQAAELFEKSLILSRQTGNKWFIAICLVNLAEIFCTRLQPERSGRLLGAASDLAQVLFAGPSLLHQESRGDQERANAAVRAALDEASFAAAFAEGQRMPLDRAIADALDPAADLEIIQNPIYARQSR